MTLTWVSTTPRRSDNLQSSDYVFSSSALLKRGLDISEFFLCWSSEFSTLSCFWGHSNFLFLTILCLPCPTLWWWWCLKDLCGVSDGDTDSPSSNLSVRESHCHTPLYRRIIATGPAGRIQRHVSHDSVVFHPTRLTVSQTLSQRPSELWVLRNTP